MNTSAVLDLNQPQHLHIVGIGGAAMSAIASICVALGHAVSGSDMQASPVLDRLRAAGIDVRVGHAPANVGPAVDALLVSTAVRPSNPEIVEARERGIPVFTRAEVMTAICATKRTVAVAGTHGKTTTTSMLALVLTDAGMRPSYLVGGQLTKIGSGVAWTSGDLFVVEADESDRTFLALGADSVIVTSIEADHLDHYGTLDAIHAAFDEFVTAAPGERVICIDDAGAARLAASLDRAITYGTAPEADYRITDLDLNGALASFTVVHDGESVARAHLPVPGAHNARNATAALAMAHRLGVDPAVAAGALARYTGVARRFEFRGERDGITFVDDYAHNPGKVEAVLAAAKSGAWRRVVAVFQPHLYSRTADLADAFGRSFHDADVVIVTDVYGAREDPRPGVTGKLIVDAIAEHDPERRVFFVPGRGELARHVRDVLQDGDLCLSLGAGDITSLTDEILADDD